MPSMYERAANYLRLVWSFGCFLANQWSAALFAFSGGPRFKLKQLCNALDVFENWKRAGFRVRRVEALGIMRFFAQAELIETREMEISEKWYELDEDFHSAASHQMINADMSLYDLVAMPAHEAPATSLTLRDYSDMARGRRFDWSAIPTRSRHALGLNLSEKAARGFYRAWALEGLMAKTDKKLTLECCEQIVDEASIRNEDLFNMCLTAQPPYEPSSVERLIAYAMNCGMMIIFVMIVRAAQSCKICAGHRRSSRGFFINALPPFALHLHFWIIYTHPAAGQDFIISFKLSRSSYIDHHQLYCYTMYTLFTDRTVGICLYEYRREAVSRIARCGGSEIRTRRRRARRRRARSYTAGVYK
ncbi:unnamed protein product [Trichogramma brassicae]|uniref:Uncharacterized protein n=1 Tax=Trichogramma brassicae TaxID=86971 RepID=A0A6H5I611_9HYME|nr:unnamed protein product [Trichogramma brassicae]